MNKLVDKAFWKKYWKTKTIGKKIGNNHFFKQLFNQEIRGKNIKTYLEIGGYPGHIALFLKKHYHINPAILDYYIDRKKILNLLKINHLKESDLAIYENDFFFFSPKHKFDLVTSFGFLEHFSDIKTIIKKHLSFTRPGGKVLITIPNFLGINGTIQKWFDPTNLSAHNLETMKTENLENIIKTLDVKKFKILYYGGLAVWLENNKNYGIFLKSCLLAINIFGRIIKIMGINSKLISPSIVIVIEK